MTSVNIHEAPDPLVQHPELQGAKFYYDPMEPLTEDEWPIELLLPLQNVII